MTHNYNASVAYYSFLQGAPKAWELLYPTSAGVQKDDTINVIEVDESGTPTGNTMTGKVIYVNTANVFRYKALDTLLYVVPN